jgi:hypothetical protein
MLLFEVQEGVSVLLDDSTCTGIPADHIFNVSGLERVHPGNTKKANEKLIKELSTGMPEDKFWDTFAQCFLCKVVTLRRNFATNHECKTAGSSRRGLVQPYFPGDVPETPSPSHALHIGGDMSSPAPTELIDEENDNDVFADVEYVLVEGEDSSGMQSLPQDTAEEVDTDDVPPPLGSDADLPTVLDLLQDFPGRL